MKRNKIFSLALLLVAVVFLTTGCFGGSDDKEDSKDVAKPSTELGLKCTYKADDETVAISLTQVVLDYNDDGTMVTKYTIVESNEFKEAYSAFVDVTKNDWQDACDLNLQGFDSCEVTSEGMKVVTTGVKTIKADSEEEINENVFANTKRADAKANYEKAGYTCE